MKTESAASEEAEEEAESIRSLESREMTGETIGEMIEGMISQGASKDREVAEAHIPWIEERQEVEEGKRDSKTPNPRE